MRRISGGKTVSSVCLFVQCVCCHAPAMCERIHTVLSSSVPGKSTDTTCAFIPRAILM